MTSVAKKLPWKVHPWRIKRLPTLPVAIGIQGFFSNKQNYKLQHIKPANSAFEARVKPIKPLRATACPHELGPIILRAFLYARQKWPHMSFGKVAPQALEAIYDSFRVDGLPRVVFTVMKEVEKPLRGKLNSTLRHRFKRRGKMAFKLAIEQLRRENAGIHCFQ
jgi:hypothetical protein